MINKTHVALQNAMEHSKFIVDKLREDLQQNLRSYPELKFCILSTGSYARKEASKESDIDLFIVIDGDTEKYQEEIESLFDEVDLIVQKYIPKPPGDTGTFGVATSTSDLMSNFGGDKDSNQTFTRRMLYLLESVWLCNEEFFKEVKFQLVQKYLKKSIPAHQINKFFLNDIIRYYRTMCTDFEFKVSEREKTWGVRNIKLRYSRKLLYFSGLLVVAETCNLLPQDKIQKTVELLSLSPLERILEICSSDHEKFLDLYNKFLEAISDSEMRKILDTVDQNERHLVKEFSRLKHASQLFSWELSKMLNSRYDVNHPIFHSLVF